MATSTEMVSDSVSDKIPENVCIRKLVSIDNGSEFHVSIPRKFVQSLCLSGYLKLTCNDKDLNIERLSL